MTTKLTVDHWCVMAAKRSTPRPNRSRPTQTIETCNLFMHGGNDWRSSNRLGGLTQVYRYSVLSDGRTSLSFNETSSWMAIPGLLSITGIIALNGLIQTDKMESPPADDPISRFLFHKRSPAGEAGRLRPSFIGDRRQYPIAMVRESTGLSREYIRLWWSDPTRGSSYKVLEWAKMLRLTFTDTPVWCAS
jgi:hypothetical protein